MAEINLPPVAEVSIDRVSHEAVAEVRRVLQHFQTEPHGDLTLNAERAAFIAVFALRDAGLLASVPEVTASHQVPVEHGLNIASGSFMCKCGTYSCPESSLPAKRRLSPCPVHGALVDCPEDCEGRRTTGSSASAIQEDSGE